MCSIGFLGWQSASRLCGYDGVGWSFRISEGEDGNVSHWDYGCSRLLADHGCEVAWAMDRALSGSPGAGRRMSPARSPCQQNHSHTVGGLRFQLQSRFRIYSLNVWQVYSQRLSRPWLRGPHPWEGLGLVHGPLQGPHLGPSSECLLPSAWVGMTAPRPLGVWCWLVTESSQIGLCLSPQWYRPFSGPYLGPRTWEFLLHGLYACRTGHRLWLWWARASNKALSESTVWI